MNTCSYYADGRWLEPASGEYLDSENPCTGEVWAQIPRCNEKDADIAVRAAWRTHHEGPWGRLHPVARGGLQAERVWPRKRLRGDVRLPVDQECMAKDRLRNSASALIRGTIPE